MFLDFPKEICVVFVRRSVPRTWQAESDAEPQKSKIGVFGWEGTAVILRVETVEIVCERDKQHHYIIKHHESIMALEDWDGKRASDLKAEPSLFKTSPTFLPFGDVKPHCCSVLGLMVVWFVFSCVPIPFERLNVLHYRTMSTWSSWWWITMLLVANSGHWKWFD